jgi:hypothetical protein
MRSWEIVSEVSRTIEKTRTVDSCVWGTGHAKKVIYPLTGKASVLCHGSVYYEHNGDCHASETFVVSHGTLAAESG